jgi:hypothetical protein
MYLNQARDLIVDLYMLQQETKERFAIELVSGPGLGKSAIVVQAGEILEKKLGKPFLIKPFFLTTVEPPDVRGFGLPGKDETDGSLIMQFTKAPWMPKKNEPKNGFIFLDEFGQAQQDVAKPAAELLLNGRVGESSLELTYMVIAASNREKDRSGVSRSLAFIENRKMRIEIEPNLDAWVDWAERNNVHPLAIAFAKWKPGVVFQEEVPSKSGPFCTPRTLCKVSHMMGKIDLETFLHAAGGYIGQGTAAELVAFLRVAEQLPTYEDIVRDPKKTPVPTRPDANYATMQLVAHRIDPKTMKSAFIYLQRMGKEFQVAALKTIMRRLPDIVQNAEFVTWIKDNKDLVISAQIIDRK